MQQAQKLQEDMKAKQGRGGPPATHCDGRRRHGETPWATGAHGVTARRLKPEISNPEDIEMLEDLLARRGERGCA